MSGEDSPNATYRKWIDQEWPGCTDWLEPDIEVSPIRRFLCALDMWGSPIDSSIRSLDTASAENTVGKGLDVLARRWASVPIAAGKDCFCSFVIPRLKLPVPDQIPDTVFQSLNPLSLMDFMFRCGPYLQLSEEEFSEWAIDLASLTLMIGALLESTSLAKRSQSGRTGDYNWLVHRIFFLPHGNWPNLESVQWALQDFAEFDNSPNYSQRLIRAREVLKEKLLSIGSDLSIVQTLSSLIINRNKMWQVPLDMHGETFAQGDLVRVKRNISPAAPGRYRYELQTRADGKKVVLCHDLENAMQSPLLERADLYDGYKGEFGWGYSGSGPTFLAISILAHHLGHDDFDSEEIDRLLKRYISKFPEKLLTGSIFLTTESVDICLNERSQRI